MNKRRLKAKMVEFGDTAQALAECLGIYRTTLSAKINEYRGAEFTQTEIIKIIERYHLTDEETSGIFFDKKSS